MIIDCDQCTAAPTACADCVVSVLIGMPQTMTNTPVQDIADEHVAAVAALAASGLVPPLRLVQGQPQGRPRPHGRRVG